MEYIMPSLLISNNHEDYTGGGTYVMMILNILKKYYTLYTDKNVHYYTAHNTPWKLNPGEIQLAPSSLVPDIHLFANYWGWIQPRGKQNIQIIYYPQPKKIEGWNKFFALNDFCKEVIDKLYSTDSHIITPYFDSSGFYVKEKKKTIINIGQYFIDPDGHCKNQHAIAEWFKKQEDFDNLIFHGKMTHPNYYRHVVNAAKGDPRIIVKADRSQAEIREDLSTSKYMVHAIGLGRTDPSQTEHFGLVAVEALLSGCQPIVHNSGGCKDIPGVLSYNNLSDITFPETDPEALRKIGLEFSIDSTEKQLLKAIHG